MHLDSALNQRQCGTAFQAVSRMGAGGGMVRRAIRQPSGTIEWNEKAKSPTLARRAAPEGVGNKTTRHPPGGPKGERGGARQIRQIRQNAPQ
jgi:hypothetical protein